MFRPTVELQLCAGISMIVLSLGGSWSMFSGAVVKFRVAGANFSVNEKLEKVKEIKEDLQNTATELKHQPKVNRHEIRQIERQLQSIEPTITDAEADVQQNLEELVKLEDK